MRGEGAADVLAEGDEQVVVADPVAARELPAQGELGALGRAGPDEAKTVTDPVDVGVDADAGLPEAHGDHEVGRLPPDAGQGEEGIEIVRHLPSEPLEQLPGEGAKSARLGAVEADGEDQPLDPTSGQRQERRRGVRYPEEPI